MAKVNTKISPIIGLISTFHLTSKLFGYVVLKPEASIACKFFREIILFCYLLLSTGCSVRAEVWCFYILQVGVSIRRLIIFSITQIIIVASASCLISYRMNNVKIFHIVSNVRKLEEKLNSCDVYLEIVYIGWRGFCLCGLQLFTIVGTMYYSIGAFYSFFMLMDSTCIFYFEAWVAIPYLQFVVWVCLLCYVLQLVRHRIVQIDRLEYIKESNLHAINDRMSRAHVRGYENDIMKIKRFVGVLKQVLSIATELSAAYGVTVFIFIVQYVARIIIQFYDIIDEDSQRFPLWVDAWNVIVRAISILLVFICCEHLKYNVNETVKLIQEIVTLHQPSCLDTIFQSLTLRLQHQSTTIQLCGFLDVTYSSFLAIMGTMIAFLVFQLQFLE